MLVKEQKFLCVTIFPSDSHTHTHSCDVKDRVVEQVIMVGICWTSCPLATCVVDSSPLDFLLIYFKQGGKKYLRNEKPEVTRKRIKKEDGGSWRGQFRA